MVLVQLLPFPLHTMRLHPVWGCKATAGRQWQTSPVQYSYFLMPWGHSAKVALDLLSRRDGAKEVSRCPCDTPMTLAAIGWLVTGVHRSGSPALSPAQFCRLGHDPICKLNEPSTHLVWKKESIRVTDFIRAPWMWQEGARELMA